MYGDYDKGQSNNDSKFKLSTVVATVTPALLLLLLLVSFFPQIRSHCSYPCECPSRQPACPEGVSVVRDGCGCCAICARQQGEPCDGTTLCDEKRGLVCQYPHHAAVKGVCQGRLLCLLGILLEMSRVMVDVFFDFFRECAVLVGGVGQQRNVDPIGREVNTDGINAR